jgi:beta-fructofuranosidase
MHQDRFWLTTRIYPARLDSTNFGIYVGDNSTVQVADLKTWEITQNAFPERPANSSSKLVYDTVEETNNRVWWTGN